MGFVRANWGVLGAGLVLQSLWQAFLLYYVSKYPPLQEIPIGPGGRAEIPTHGWGLVILIGGWVELPALVIAGPLITGWSGWLRGSILFALTWATWVLLLMLARRVVRLTHRAISSL
jgi:hypothetical protein